MVTYNRIESRLIISQFELPWIYEPKGVPNLINVCVCDLNTRHKEVGGTKT